VASSGMELPNRSESEFFHELPLSDYMKSLGNIVQKRYIDKISCISMDPVL